MSTRSRPGTAAALGDRAPAPAGPARCGAACRRLDISTRRAGSQAAGSRGAQEQVGPEVVAADERSRAEHVPAEAGEDVGQPVGRVGVARAVLGVAVSGKVGQHDPEAVGQVADRRLELLVASARPSAAAPAAARCPPRGRRPARRRGGGRGAASSGSLARRAGPGRTRRAGARGAPSSADRLLDPAHELLRGSRSCAAAPLRTAPTR